MQTPTPCTKLGYGVERIMGQAYQSIEDGHAPDIATGL